VTFAVATTAVLVVAVVTATAAVAVADVVASATVAVAVAVAIAALPRDEPHPCPLLRFLLPTLTLSHCCFVFVVLFRLFGCCFRVQGELFHRYIDDSIIVVAAIPAIVAVPLLPVDFVVAASPSSATSTP